MIIGRAVTGLELIRLAYLFMLRVFAQPRVISLSAARALRVRG